MAQHKVGNKYLDDQEYELHSLEMWGFWLFVLGAVITGAIILDYIPEGWSKELRYGVLVSSCGFVGLVLAKLTPYIRTAFYIGILIAAIAGALYWAWTLV